MAEDVDTKAEASAEKAYAAAAEALSVKAAPADAVDFPSKAARSAKPKLDQVAPAPAPAKAKPRAARPAKLKATVVRRRAQPAKRGAAKAPLQPSTAKMTPAETPAPVSKPTFLQFKDKIMATTPNEFAAKFQDKAKAAYEKSTAAFGDYNEFAKGNLEAVVESGKILAAGLQELGNGFVAEAKTALETATADAKDLSAVRSPADFFRLQGEIVRRNFDTAVAFGSRNSETLLKIASDAAAPISNRVALAVEKVRQAA
jgi:phasin family protein